MTKLSDRDNLNVKSKKDAGSFANIVDYGSVVKVSIDKGGNKRIRTVLLSDSDEPSEHVKISIKSPLGKLLYHREVGFNGTYKVGSNELTATILSIE